MSELDFWGDTRFSGKQKGVSVKNWIRLPIIPKQKQHVSIIDMFVYLGKQNSAVLTFPRISLLLFIYTSFFVELEGDINAKINTFELSEEDKKYTHTFYRIHEYGESCMTWLFLSDFEKATIQL